jgi:hypothetical protein
VVAAVALWVQKLLQVLAKLEQTLCANGNFSR